MPSHGKHDTGPSTNAALEHRDYGLAITSRSGTRSTPRGAGALVSVVGVVVPTLIFGASLSVAGGRVGQATRPTVLPTTSVAPVPELAAGLPATLEAAAAVEVTPANLRPSLPDARQGTSILYDNGCHVPTPAVEPLICNHGDVDGDVEVVLVGDSHAAQWFPALDALAQQSGILLHPMTKSGCTVADVPVFHVWLGRQYTECAEWRTRMLAAVADLAPDVVIVSQVSAYQVVGLPPEQWSGAMRAGYATTFELLDAVAGDVVLLADTPISPVDVPNCVWQHLVHVDTCVPTRIEAFASRLVDVERGSAADAGVRYVQADDLFCGPKRCPVIVGDILVYIDNTHVTAEYMTWVAPALAPVLGAPWRAG